MRAVSVLEAFFLVYFVPNRHSCRIRARRMEDRGLEPPANSSGKTQIAGQGGAKSGALGAQSVPKVPAIDTSMDQLISAWSTLPEAVKAGIEAMIVASAR